MSGIETRFFAGAFLRYDDEVLLMKRSEHKKIAPGLWSGIGGRIEEAEMNSPLTSCLREIEEETGIKASQIEKLDFRYFALIKSEFGFQGTGHTLDSIYYFTGVLKEKPPLIETPEGSLYWVKPENSTNLHMSDFIKAFYPHFINNLSDDNIYCYIDSQSTPPLKPGGWPTIKNPIL